MSLIGKVLFFLFVPGAMLCGVYLVFRRVALARIEARELENMVGMYASRDSEELMKTRNRLMKSLWCDESDDRGCELRIQAIERVLKERWKERSQEWR